MGEGGMIRPASLAIISVDPGNVTGMDLMLINAGESKHRETVEVPYGRVGVQLREWDRALSGWHDPVHIAVEKYVMTPGVKTAQPNALMVMGVTEDMALMHDWKHFYYPPKTCKTIGSDGMLKKINWYEKTKDGHLNDARRVTITHMANAHHLAFGRLTGI
jgi:hypothetical protein